MIMQRNMTRPLLFILIASMAAGAYARHLTGIVVDENKEPLPYATLKVRNKPIGALGDSTGSFSLRMDYVRPADTIAISYVGYEDKMIIAGQLAETDSIRIELTPAPKKLRDVVVAPSKNIKIKTKKMGKKHASGLMTASLNGEMAGECFGYEFHAKKGSKLLLSKVGFYYRDGENQMTKMRFRINVYDMSAVKGSMSNDFVSALSKPIYFDYAFDPSDEGKFEYELPEQIVLPDDALVSIEFVENLADEIFYFKNNLVGKRIWDKSLVDETWLKSPFASPFFVECAEVKTTTHR